MKTRSKRGTVKRKTPTTQDSKPQSSDSVSRRSFTKADPAKHSPDISVPKKNPPRSTARIASPNQERGASFPLLLAKRGEGRDEEPQGTRGNSAPVLNGLRGEMVPKAQAENSLDSLSRRSQTKADPTKLLESALTARRKSQTELTNLRQLLADKSAQAAALETTGDLHDPAVLAEIGRLQILTGLLPRRIAGTEEQDANAEMDLIHATNQFIQAHLGPRVRRLAAQTRATVEAGLPPHLQHPRIRIEAVAQSERVRTIEALAWSASLTPARGAIAHAEGALKAWVATDKFETTHISKPQMNANNRNSS